MPERLKIRFVQLLRWSERYTKTDMVYLTKGGFWLLLGHAIQAASGLTLAIAFANLLPKETFGTYQFIMSMASIISALTLTGMGTAITRAVAQGSEGALRAGFHTQMRWSSIMVLVGAGLAAYYYVNENYVLALSFLISGTFSPFITGFGLGRSHLIGKQLFRESALLGLWRKIFPVVSILTTIYFTQDVVTLIFVYFVSNAISTGLFYWLVVQRYRLPRTEEQDMVSYSKHLSALKIFSETVNQIDKVLIWVLLGAAPLASYALAQLPITHMRGVSKLALSLTLPKLSITIFADLQKTLPHKIRIFFLVMASFVAIYIGAASFLFPVLFPAYPESVLLSQALALTILVTPRGLYGQAMIAHKEKKSLYILSIGQGFLKIALLVMLIPLFGLWGAVLSVLITHLFGAILSHYLFFRIHSQN